MRKTAKKIGEKLIEFQKPNTYQEMIINMQEMRLFNNATTSMKRRYRYSFPCLTIYTI